MKRNLARVILTLAGIIWGLGFIGNKYLIDNNWTEAQLLFVRFGTATLLIFIVYIKRILRTNLQVIKKGLSLGILLYLGFFFQTWGLAHTTASNNALITAGYIVVLPVIIFIMEKKGVHYKTVIAGFVTLMGIGFISLDFSDLSVAFGDVLTFIGSIFYGAHIYFLGKQTKKVDLFVLMAFQLLMFSFFATIALIIDGGLPVSLFDSKFKLGLLGIAVSLGVFGSFIAFLFQSIGQKNTNEAEAAILISTESLFGPLFAILFYNDPFNIYILLGIIFVFSGIVLSEIDITVFFKKEEKTNEF